MNAIAPTAFVKVDKATFLDFAERHAGRCEYVRGRIIMQAGGTFIHARIAQHILRLLHRQLDPDRWIATGSDRGVETPDTVRYPDVTVELVGADPKSRYTENPVLAVEVLSATSEERDLDTKPLEYRAIASLQAYIVASQDEPACLVWLRDANGAFPAEPVAVNGHTATISVPALGLQLPLADIYRGLS
jgi:Uma2 family endonuclease